MDASINKRHVRIALLFMLLLLFSPFVLCTPKVQDIDFNSINGVYTQGNEYTLFVIKDMGTLKTFKFQPIGQGFENIGLMMSYIFREPNELCEILDGGDLKYTGRVHLKKDGSLVVSGLGEFDGRYYLVK